jgi:outer membrane protein assembly factor BamB
VLQEATYILTVKVQTLDPARPAMVLAPAEPLKGKVPFARLAVSLKGDAEAAKEKETPLLLKRLATDLPLVLFINQRDDDYTAFAYSNGTWFQMVGGTDAGTVRWSFTHLEPYLRRTYKGTTAELRQLIAEGLAGKARLPPVNPKEKPGLGPEVPPPVKKENRGWRMEDRGQRVVSAIPHPPFSQGPIFAVIPSVLIGGPLAVLAMLFPAVFGGLILFFRRWMAGLSVVSLNSTLYLAQSWFSGQLLESWWSTPEALWLTMSAVTLLGTLWAWRRHLAHVAGGATGFEAPGNGEVLTLTVLSLLVLAGAAWWLPRSVARLDLWGKTLVTFACGLWLATLHAVYLRIIAAKSARPALPGEGVMLWAMLVAGTGLAMTFSGTAPADTNGGQAAQQTEGDRAARFSRVAWRFPPREPCWIASSPRIEGDRVYVGAVHGSAFRSGAVYCLDRATGTVRWSFNNKGKMKDIFSSPAVAEGRLFIGEGFHQDAGCKLYCLEAADGKKLWEHPTGSHTESTPCVANGKVYFGAGDDGLYCLDAATGAEQWHLNGLHVDANPVVVDGRLYCGSGVGDVYKDTVVFCLDAFTGKEYWRTPTDLPVWGEPALVDGKVFIGIGNGNFLESAERPAGAVLGLDAATGRRLWRHDARDGVHTRIVADRDGVWFGSRDGHCYCVAPADGAERWKADLGSPVLASPALAPGGAHIVALGSEGRVCCLDAKTGRIDWTFDVAKNADQPATLFSSPAVVVEPDGRRCICFGSGLSTFTRGLLYCLEDTIEPSKP